MSCSRKYRRIFFIIGCALVLLCVKYSLFSSISEFQLKPCTIEVLDPWDQVLRPFLRQPPPLKCSEKFQLMYVDAAGYLQFNTSVASLLRLNTSQLHCTYQHILRQDGDMKLVFQIEVVFKTSVFIKSHVFRVKCTWSGNTVYDRAHFNQLWTEDAKADARIETEDADKLSVIMFGIDSVSRSHAVRNLPKSYKFLTDEFHSYDFVGYSKIGENTFPNIVPLLTGNSHRSFPLVEHIHVHTDDMPLLWNERIVKEQIASFFAEDRPDISTFNYAKGGFRKAPTDFYFRPYTLAMHEFEPVIIKPLGKANWNCYGNQNYFDLQIEYLKGFLTKYRRKRKLAFFWSNQVGHEEFTTLSRGDDSFLELLQWLQDTNALNNTVFIVLSDHGFRIGGASLTTAGRAENNKPWLMMHVPKHVIKRNAWMEKILSENTHRLVSHYDTYQTVLDILNNKPFHEREAQPLSNSLVKRSLFSPIPEERTCADAGIEEKYCTCRGKTYLSSSTPLAHSMAEHLVSGINTILSNHSKLCENVRLHNVTEVSVIYSTTDDDNLPAGQKAIRKNKRHWYNIFIPSGVGDDTLTGRYTLLFYTQHGRALFEGTVDYAQYEADVSHRMTMVGEPSRLNRYGNQAHCVQDSFIRLFCYCKIQL